MGRNRIHTPETLEVGQRVELTGKAKKYSWQYVYNFNNRGEQKFKHVKEDKKIFIERTE